MSTRSSLGVSLGNLLSWIYPEKCRECDVPIHALKSSDHAVVLNRFFCRDCWEKIEGIGGRCCPVCSHPFQSGAALSHSPDHVCGDCRRDPPCFTLALTPYRYEGALIKAIQLFKYEEQVVLAKPLADLLIGALRGLKIDVVMGVPLHPTRLRSRSFNQSILLAKRLALHFSWPLYVDVMYRTRETLSQVGLSKKARQKNMRGVFSVQRQERISGQCVLLVDDVYTTGATLKEGAKTLKKAGAKEVFVAAPVRMLFGI
ncbi:Competence protein F homolog, phosphoribosyltransferase domain; protein YhgH required for utilization of DNA as sole source of carbon and energy [hydrothermal vent metagenome]|uniref:Competence protein F homolog, phosphoribosyltransferase domain protein YhgH required for utilization of DNA as sole source of carbon and energy n=1 Tax=hydrothermal vent metagenome TaxID=652676 RepID=A0A3B1DC37_9ZZZZ